MGMSTEAEGACRALAARAKTAALGTIALADPVGAPYVSLVHVAWDERGALLLLLSRLAEHTKNLDADARASLLVTEDPLPAEPLTASRMTLTGKCTPLTGADADEARARFVAAHPNAAQYASFGDFGMWRFEVAAIRWVGGFGRMTWVPASALAWRSRATMCGVLIQDAAR
jgi:putative heme iron utilization protein